VLIGAVTFFADILDIVKPFADAIEKRALEYGEPHCFRQAFAGLASLDVSHSGKEMGMDASSFSYMM
jgi:hypothetical protein